MTATMDLPVRLLNKGADYFRERMLQRDSGFERTNRRSAVELLEETKPLYVKSESVCHSRQMINNSYNLQAGIRRSQTSTFGGYVHCSSGVECGTEACGPEVNHGFMSCQDQDSQNHHCPNKHGRLKKSQTHCGVSGQGGNFDTHCGVVSGDFGKHTDDSNNEVLDTNLNLNLDTAYDTEAVAQHVECMEFPNSVSKLKRPRFNGSSQIEAMECNANKPLGEAASRLRQQDVHVASISTEEWSEIHSTDASTEMDQQSSHGSLVKDEEGIPVIRRRHKKAVSRSRSDLTKRCSNSSELSELSARFSRNSADLEKFFNEMGLDKSVLEPMISGQCSLAQSTSSLNVFDGVSSVGSPDVHSWGSGNSQKAESDRGIKSLEFEERTPAQTSVVERNARIIKWLFSVKKAGTSAHPD